MEGMSPMRNPAVVCAVAVLALALRGTPAAADCRPAIPSDATYTGVGRSNPVTRSTPAQNDARNGFAGLLDPNRDGYDPGTSSYGAKYGESYGGAPGSINDQASTFLGTPCGPPMTLAPLTQPVAPTQAPPVIVAPAGTLNANGLAVPPGTLNLPNQIPSIPAPQTLTVAPWNPAETNNALR